MTNHHWSLACKVGFRFSFIFILSFILVMNNGAFPLFGYVSKPVDLLFRQITPWFATHILQYDYDHSVGITGSGDTSYAWVTLLIIGTPKTWAVDFVDVYLS